MRKIILLAFSFLTLHAATVDQTLYESNDLVAEYEKRISERATIEQTPQVQYEVKLLHKLIELQKNPLAFQLPHLADASKSEKSYIDALFEYATALNNQAESTSRISQLSKNMDYLEGEITNISESTKTELMSLQLQYAMYKISQKMLQQGVEEFESKRLELFNQLLEAKQKVEFDTNNSQTGQEKIQVKLQDIKSKQRLLMIDLDKYTIENNQENIEQSKKQLEEITEQKNELNIQKFRFMIVEVLQALKQNDTVVFEKYKQLEKIKISDQLNMSIRGIIKEMITNQMGMTQTTISTTKESFIDLLKYTWKMINKPLFVYQEKEISTFSFLKVALIFFIGYIIRWLYKFKILYSKKLIRTVSVSNRTILANLGSYVIFIITFLVALNSIGLDLSSFAMIAGALSVGIGFGLQNVVSNFISGIILMFEKSIRVGDIVEIDQTLKGTISKIDMRSTIVNTFDNIDVIIPNSSFIANNVINYTYGDRTRRLHIPFGVAYGTPVDKVKEVVLEALEKSDLAFIRTKEDKRPEVWMSSMNASSVDYELLVWVNAATDKTEQSSRMKDFLELIYTTFYERGIEIPFPQLDVHFKKDQTE
ncbi:MAG: hypothetical protein RL113_163 [Pseudomonadota bacterium]